MNFNIQSELSKQKLVDLSSFFIFTVAKEVMFSVRFVELKFCSQQDYRKTTGPIFKKTGARVNHGP